ncbi:hypothetical protein D3105_27185, partial [Streptomyces globisporus]
MSTTRHLVNRRRRLATTPSRAAGAETEPAYGQPEADREPEASAAPETATAPEPEPDTADDTPPDAADDGPTAD